MLLSFVYELQLLHITGRIYVVPESVAIRMQTKIIQPQMVTGTVLKCVFYLWVAGYTCSSINKRSPSLPLEHSYVRSFKSIPATIVFNSTFMYRYFKRPLKLLSFEKEAGLVEPEPEITLAIKKADSILSSAVKSVASRLMEVIPALSSALV